MILPSPRSGAALAMSAAGKLWLVGGNDGASSLNDVWQYSMQDSSWVQARQQSHLPPVLHSLLLSTGPGSACCMECMLPTPPRGEAEPRANSLLVPEISTPLLP